MFRTLDILVFDEMRENPALYHISDSKWVQIVR